MSCSSNGHYYVFQPVKATFTIMLSYTHCFFDWGLNLGPPALEASTIPLGYRGGGKHKSNSYDHRFDNVHIHAFESVYTYVGCLLVVYCICRILALALFLFSPVCIYLCAVFTSLRGEWSQVSNPDL